VTVTIPVLAAAATALPVLFVITRMTRHGGTNLFPDVLLFLAYMWVLLWGTLAHARRWLMALGIAVNLAIPLLLLLISRKAGEVAGAHAVALLLLFAIAWYPTVIVQECAGVALRRLSGADAERPMPATSSRASIIILFIIGALIFIGGGVPTDGGDHTTVAIVFALPFTLCVFGLLSLARLIRKAHETPQQPIMISPNFLRRWIALMIGVLLMAAVLATIMPKNPLQSLVARLNQSAQERQRERPSQEIFRGTSRVGQTTRRDGDGGPQPDTRTGNPGNSPDRHPGSGTDHQPAQRKPGQGGEERKPGTVPETTGTHSPRGKPVTVKPDSGAGKGDGKTTAPDAKPGKGEETVTPPGNEQGKGGDGKPGAAKTGKDTTPRTGDGKAGGQAEKDARAPSPPAAAGPKPPNAFLSRVKDAVLSLLLYLAYLGEQDPPPIPMGNPVTPELVAAKAQMLRDAVRENPLRLVKLIIIGLLVLIGFGRFLWYLWEWARRRFFHRPEPEVREVMAQFDPFADPFAREHPSPEALIHAVYVTFLAHLWLRGYERQPAQTEFDFASWLEQNTPLNARPIWTITRACTYAEYAEQPLSPEEMPELRGALQALTQDIRAPFTDAVLRERMQTYRAIWAERAVAQRHTEAPAPAE